MRIYLHVALLALALSVAPAAMGRNYIERRALKPDAFPQLLELIDRELQPGGRFQHLDEIERQLLAKELARMSSILQGHQSVEELAETERVDLINAQERANAILTQKDGERLICERRALVGSHKPETVCETYADRRIRTNKSRHIMSEMQKKTLPFQ
jgi:hypothetical protein